MMAVYIIDEARYSKFYFNTFTVIFYYFVK